MYYDAQKATIKEIHSILKELDIINEEFAKNYPVEEEIPAKKTAEDLAVKLVKLREKLTVARTEEDQMKYAIKLSLLNEQYAKLE